MYNIYIIYIQYNIYNIIQYIYNNIRDRAYMYNLISLLV